ncbi:ATP-binding cassette domain-containing protein [Roseiflexus sp.]
MVQYAAISRIVIMLEHSAISLTDVTVRAHQRVILDHLTLEIPQGAVVGVIGPNGSGKTTLFRLLGG